jgi:hypothetical protein
LTAEYAGGGRQSKKARTSARADEIGQQLTRKTQQPQGTHHQQYGVRHQVDGEQRPRQRGPAVLADVDRHDAGRHHHREAAGVEMANPRTHDRG